MRNPTSIHLFIYNSSDSKCKFNIKSQGTKEFRKTATSLTYAVVAFNNNKISIYNWLCASNTSNSQNYNIDKITKKEREITEIIYIMALCFAKGNMEELNHLDAIFYGELKKRHCSYDTIQQ